MIFGKCKLHSAYNKKSCDTNNFKQILSQ